MQLDAQKTTAASLSGAITVIAVWAAQYFWHVTVPPEIAAAFGVLLSGVLSHIPMFSNPTNAG